MSEKDPEIGELEGWPPLDPRDRTETGLLERILEEILFALRRRKALKGGLVEDWPPLDPRERTEASPVQKAFQKLLTELKEALGVLGKGKKLEDNEQEEG